MATLVFDVNETLLDLRGLEDLFFELFGDRSTAQDWFHLLLQLSMVSALTGVYRDFEHLGGDALRMIAQRRRVELSEARVELLPAAMRNMPPHPDVKHALDRLRHAEHRLVALSNSPYRLLNPQLENAGLAGFFDETLSVDEARTFKPDPRVYRMCAEKMGEPIEDLTMVAAHNWDITGAIRAGMKGAFVARPGRLLGDADELPEMIVPDIGALADRLLHGVRF